MWRGDESRKGDTETPNTFLLMPKLCAKRETGMYGTNQIRLVTRAGSGGSGGA
jgi:hypothetical protein